MASIVWPTQTKHKEIVQIHKASFYLTDLTNIYQEQDCLTTKIPLKKENTGVSHTQSLTFPSSLFVFFWIYSLINCINVTLLQWQSENIPRVLFSCDHWFCDRRKKQRKTIGDHKKRHTITSLWAEIITGRCFFEGLFPFLAAAVRKWSVKMKRRRR